MSAIAIITAFEERSMAFDSENIEFCDKKMILYSIEAAVESRIFDIILVISDSKELATDLSLYSSIVRQKNEKQVLINNLDTIDKLNLLLKRYKTEIAECDEVFFLNAQTPFVTSDVLHKAYKRIKEKKALAVISVVKYDFPPQRAYILEDNKAKYQYPENANVRSQDLQNVYYDCRQFYIINKSCLEDDEKVSICNCIPYIYEEEKVHIIADEYDLKVAEKKYNAMKNEVI